MAPNDGFGATVYIQSITKQQASSTRSSGAVKTM